VTSTAELATLLVAIGNLDHAAAPDRLAATPALATAMLAGGEGQWAGTLPVGCFGTTDEF
jgi:hypothetical protein